MTRSVHRAFTLIELLVVITIIVVLLALLIPALDKAIYQAELAMCLSNTRTQHSAQYQYAYDNGRRLTFRNGAVSPDYHRWGGSPSSPVDVLRGTYLTNTKVMICPIVAQVPSQTHREYRRNDWSTRESNDPVLIGLSAIGGTWGGWDTSEAHVYTAYSWLGGFGEGVTYTMSGGEPAPPMKISDLASGGLFITHRLDFYAAGNLHEVTHGGRGLGQTGAMPDGYETTDMPLGYGDGHATIRLRDQIDVRMVVGNDFHMW